jgi:hypothetical protein
MVGVPDPMLEMVGVGATGFAVGAADVGATGPTVGMIGFFFTGGGKTAVVTPLEANPGRGVGRMKSREDVIYQGLLYFFS